MNLQDHMIKGTSNFMKGTITTPPGLVATDIVIVEIMLLNIPVASSEHVFKRLCNFVDGSFSK